MTPAREHTARSLPPAPPLALVFSARLLLTEKSSVTGERFLTDVRVEAVTIQAAVVTPVKREVWDYRTRGYTSGGIND